MGRNVRNGRDLRDLCAHVEDGDGVDPRLERRRDDTTWTTRQARVDAELAVAVARIVEDQIASSPETAARVIGSHVQSRGAHVVVVVEGLLERPLQLAAAAREQLARRLNRARVPSISIRCVNIGTVPEPGPHAAQHEKQS